MAKQESILKMRGAIGDLSFTKHRTRGYEVRTKGGVDKQRIMDDPNFQRTRENMSEFGSAASKARQIRQQLNNITRGTADSSLINRLMSQVHRILKRDLDSNRGERKFRPENAGQLKGFQFNRNSNLSLLFAPLLESLYDRNSGSVTLNIPPFDPQVEVHLLPGATHVRFSLAVAQLPDTDDVLPRPVVAATGYIPLIGVYEGTDLRVQLPEGLTDVVYSVVGMSVHQQVGTDFYPLKNGLHNALTIVQVDVAAD